MTVRLRDGAQLWTTARGTGPLVVLLHGGPGLWDYLAPLAALLDDTFTVVRFDQRGCGRSTGDDGPFTIAQAVDDLDQLRMALGFPRWAVAGHSWGAELALRYAAACPDHVTSVAYIAGAGHARQLWETRPPGAVVNEAANRGLWGDRLTEDLDLAAARVRCPVTLLCGADDPRPWAATDSLLGALPEASRIVLDHAGHAPGRNVPPTLAGFCWAP
jgi:proline iminopeptidase